MENDEAENQQPGSQEQKKRQAPSYNDIRQTIKTVKTVVRIVRLAANPTVAWTLVAIFAVIVIYMLFFHGGGSPFGGGDETSQQNQATGTGSASLGPGPAQDSVLGWAQRITSALQIGNDNGFDRLSAPISSNSYSTGTSEKYWCTYLVVDSFNLAGYSGLSKGSHGGVVYMIGFWKTNSNYVFLDYYNLSHQTVLGQVQPGYAIFFQDVPGMTTIGNFDHAAIVKSLSVDSHGNGALETNDANLPTLVGTTVRYPVVSWEIKGTLKEVGHPTYSVMGFGYAK